MRGRREHRERAPAEVVIVSFPKSGRTWLRLLIGKALCEHCGLPDSRMLDTLSLSREAGLRPTVFSHDGASNTEARHMRRLRGDKSEYENKHVVFLRRDPRDVVVSCFFQASRRRDLFSGDLSDFLRDPHYGIDKILRYYNVWYRAREVPTSFALISYEALHARPVASLRIALDAMGCGPLPDVVLEKSVSFGQFENMRRMESEGRFESSRMTPGHAGDPESFKVRKGEVGGHRDYLSEADQAYVDARLAQVECPLLDLNG